MIKIYTVLLDPVEPGNVCFHLYASNVEHFDDYTLIVDGVELMTKDKIVDVTVSTMEEDVYQG